LGTFGDIFSTSVQQPTVFTWAVGGLAVCGLLLRPLAASPSVGRGRLGAAPGAGLQAQASAGQGAGAPGTPGGHAPVHGTVFQGTVPQAMLTVAKGVGDVMSESRPKRHKMSFVIKGLIIIFLQ